MALRNIGKAYVYPSPTGAGNPNLGSPPSFTPALGASFAVVKTDTLALVFSPDISFPTFQDIRLDVGMRFSVADTFFLNASYAFDLRETIGVDGTNAVRNIPFGFGISMKLNGLGVKPAGQDVTEFNSTVAAAPLANGVWGFSTGVNVPIGVRNVTPPAITLDTDGEKWISPNFDGIQDDLVLPLSITDKRYVKGYKFIVTDSSGTAVRTILNKEDRPEERDFKNILARLAYVKTGITVPPTIRWDGMSDTGTVVPDGTYNYHIEAWDDNNNQGTSGVGTVIVKTVPPKIAPRQA